MAGSLVASTFSVPGVEDEDVGGDPEGLIGTILVVSNASPSVGGDVGTGDSGIETRPSFLLSALATDGGGVVLSAVLNGERVGIGAVMADWGGTGGAMGALLSGAVLAVSAFIREGSDGFFSRGFVCALSRG